MLNLNQNQLLDNVFYTARRDIEAKNRAKEDKNNTCEEVEKMYKDLCKILKTNKEWLIIDFNQQSKEVQEHVLKMLRIPL